MIARSSGLLQHITSLPSALGIGDLGPEAYRFVDFLHQAQQRWWQILPLNPIDPAFDSSPYHSISAYAKNPLLISPELLVRDGLLLQSELEAAPALPSGTVDYEAVVLHRSGLFDQAHERFRAQKDHGAFARFCVEQADWLDAFALFMALKSHFRAAAWGQWPPDIRDRKPEALRHFSAVLQQAIAREKFLQFVFHRQWDDLRRYAAERGVRFFGDVPIYVDYDSADVWTRPEIFRLDDNKKPTVVAGVPPDYFSATGQRWGNPIYCWDMLRQRGYDWWLRRLEHNFLMFDLLRIDHFRGLVAYWEIPASEPTAIKGTWVEAPAADFLTQVRTRMPSLALVAEDLGVITPDVKDIMRRFDLPGMKILLFAFGDDLATNPYVPHNIVKNAVVYTGTHDNNTARGWFDQEATPDDKQRLFRYLGRQVAGADFSWELIRLAMMTVADLVIVPTQDVLGLGQEARMNRPSTCNGNWRWRVLPGQLTAEHAAKLRSLAETYGRLTGPPGPG